jgi:excisionase family DNA binding protein
MPHCGKPVVPLSERLGYDVGETAALINSSVSFVYELIRRGELETVKVGGRRIVPRWALEALLSFPIDAVLANKNPPPAPVSETPVSPVTTARRSLSRAPPCRTVPSVARRIKQEEGV